MLVSLSPPDLAYLTSTTRILITSEILWFKIQVQRRTRGAQHHNHRSTFTLTVLSLMTLLVLLLLWLLLVLVLWLLLRLMQLKIWLLLLFLTVIVTTTATTVNIVVSCYICWCPPKKTHRYNSGTLTFHPFFWPWEVQRYGMTKREKTILCRLLSDRVMYDCYSKVRWMAGW